jgi:exoribonuclease-2
MMQADDRQHRSILRSIARRPMLGRGLLPDFPPQALAKHCTKEEDAAKKVERKVEKSTAALLLESRIGERFDALVTGASDKGTWVRLLQPSVEGRLVSGFQGLDAGHRLRVQLVHTDVERGFIDFKRAR